ncbi:MAG: alpha,alpha-trehalase TreF [Bacteroidota bacterium]|nr:alpha,alpha-trehalase TreF [Bacteroidota bacterium]
MLTTTRFFYSAFLVIFLLAGCKSGPDPDQELQMVQEEIEILPPGELYGDLFEQVQTRSLFQDSKTFADAVPQYNVGLIRQRYEMLDDTTTEGLKDFVVQHFMIPQNEASFKTDSSSIHQHIQKLWQVLQRPADAEKSGTLIPLPNPYIVPGGRFREIYYWDSYFTMLGLQTDGEVETIQHMVDNFAYLIDTYGFIPNGNRTYYLGRSQPPFFAMMVRVLSEEKGDAVLKKYLPQLEKEYKFWMSGRDSIQSDESMARIVKMPDGSILNRYWDNYDTPRPESYREDMETAEKALEINPSLTKEEVYRNLRAGAESGWDFSSRWLSKVDGKFSLATIHTTDIIPVDLNALLYNLEKTIAKAAMLAGQKDKSRVYLEKADARREALLKYCWSKADTFFMDYNFRKKALTGQFSLAGMYPLFFNMATPEQAESSAKVIREKFLKPGGVTTTLYHTGEQWDAPNGWAPLQYITVKALENYDENELATTIRDRWVKLNEDVYSRTYKMTEKYNVEDLTKESGGGEYPTQDGFGWSNGVYQKLSSE